MNISKLLIRPQTYALDDGVAELTLGCLLVVSFGIFSPVISRTLPLLVPQAIWLGISLGVFWGAKKLKERVTYPRVGYVALDEPTVTIRGRRLGLRVPLIFGMFGLIFVVREFPAAMAVVLSAGFFGLYVFSAIRYRMPHMVWLAAFSALLGLWVYGRNESRAASLVFLMIWQGASLTVVGALNLWRFVKSHPRPAETEA